MGEGGSEGGRVGVREREDGRKVREEDDKGGWE